MALYSSGGTAGTQVRGQPVQSYPAVVLVGGQLIHPSMGNGFSEGGRLFVSGVGSCFSMAVMT